MARRLEDPPSANRGDPVSNRLFAVDGAVVVVRAFTLQTELF
jgi:hypothetical protein